MALPKGKVKATKVNPKTLLMIGGAKIGKTSLCAGLADFHSSLIIDLEDGSNYVDACSVKIPMKSKKEVQNSLTELQKLLKEIHTEKKPYKTIIVDSITKLEDMAEVLATKNYKESSQGKKFEGDSVLELGQGYGYRWLREAMRELMDWIELSADQVIYIGHLKDKLITAQDGITQINAKEINLSGKVALMVMRDVEANCFIYRDKDKNANYLSFKTNGELACGSRCEHLRNKEILISELKDEKLVTYWDKIYLPE